MVMANGEIEMTLYQTAMISGRMVLASRHGRKRPKSSSLKEKPRLTNSVLHISSPAREVNS
jgi:hypothetical protein